MAGLERVLRIASASNAAHGWGNGERFSRCWAGIVECRPGDGKRRDPESATILWIIAAILVIVGIVQLLQGQIIFGIVLIVIACLVGPGGYSIFRSRR